MVGKAEGYCRLFYGYLTDGLAQVYDFESVNTTTGKYQKPKFPLVASQNGIVQPGDIKYRDISGPDGAQPDLVVGGINHGDNSSVNLHYSGTMGVVIEGCLKGVPSIGFSLCNHEPNAIRAVKLIAGKLADAVLEGRQGEQDAQGEAAPEEEAAKVEA